MALSNIDLATSFRQLLLLYRTMQAPYDNHYILHNIEIRISFNVKNIGYKFVS